MSIYMDRFNGKLYIVTEYFNTQTFWQLTATFVSGLAEMFGVIKLSVARDFH